MTSTRPSGARRVHRRRARAIAAALAAVLVPLALAPVTPAASAGGQGGGTGLDPTRLGTRTAPQPSSSLTTTRTLRRDSEVRTQRITVRWQGDDPDRVYAKSAVVPGIGHLSLVCRPKATLVRLYAFDRSAETQMWMAKYETKGGRPVVATKNARIYTYDHADDDGQGGTGRYAHEGLNQWTPIEDFSSGYIDGVISQRPGRHRAGHEPWPPVTAFKLNWWWERFSHPVEYRFCKISAVLTTRLDSSIGVNWHGDQNAAGHEVQRTDLPGIGELEVRCESDQGGTVDGRQWVTLRPVSEDAWVRATWISQEGPVEDHVETIDLGYDPVTGQVGPLEGPPSEGGRMPRNGMMTLAYTVAGVRRDLVLSSYQITNNRKGPHRNLCEVAVGEW